MTNIETCLARACARETISFQDEDLPEILAELHAAVTDPATLRSLGLFALSLVTANIRAGASAQKAAELGRAWLQ